MSTPAGPPTTAPCHLQSAATGEPLAGTAPYALGWLVLEQPGPWGPRALTESLLDRTLGARIEAACAATDVRPALVRRPGRDPLPPTRTLLAAHSMPGRSWLLSSAVEDPADVDWEQLATVVADGDRAAVLGLLPDAVEPAAQLLVCSNGRRDVCCAVQGRPVALAASAEAPGQVWEATHLGGHRFAPTAALLPSGVVHGRLDAAAALAALEAEQRGELVIGSARGRTVWSGPGQAAELAVRHLVDERSLHALTVAAGDGDMWVVRHVDGRAWQAAVTERTGPVSRPESCGRDAVPVCSWVAGDPQPL